MKTCGVILTIVLGLFGKLGAQQPANQTKSPLPAGPLIVNIAAMDAWRIDYMYDQGKKLPMSTAEVKPIDLSGEDVYTSSTKQVTITITESVWHIEVEKNKGGKIEQWYDGVTQYVEAPQVGVYVLQDTLFEDGTSQYAGGLIDINNKKLPGMEIVSTENYARVEKVDGVLCWVFTANGVTAWVDMNSRYPVKWSNNQESRIYKRMAAPVEKLKMPASISKIKEAREKDLQRLTVPNRPRG